MTNQHNSPAQAKLRAFTAYTGNVKERLNELPLGPLTAIVGEEATYKSTIAIGIRLALTGAYDAIGKVPSDLLVLAADPSVGIETTLSGPDGVAYWRLRVDPEGKAKKPERPRFEGAISSLSDVERAKIIPSDSVRELLKDARGERKLREKFIARFGGASHEIPEPIALDQDEHALWAKALKECRADLAEDVSADTLLAKLSEYLRKEAGAKRREMTPIQGLINQRKVALLEQEQENDASPEEVEEIEALLQRAKGFAQVEKTRQLKGIAEAELEAIQADIERLTTEAAKGAEQAKDQLTTLRASVSECEKNRNEALLNLLDAGKKAAAYSLLSDAYARAIASGKRQCQFCPTQFPDQTLLISVKESFDTKVTKYNENERIAQELYTEADKAYITAQTAENQHNDRMLHLSHAQERIHDQVRRRFAEISATIKTYENALANVPTTYAGPTVEVLQRKLDTIKGAFEARTALVREGTKLRKLEKDHAILKKLEVEAIELQKQVMTRVAKTASEAVSLGMLDGRRARLDPHTCEWYVTRKDGCEFPFGALCGTEKTSLLLGLVAAWTRGSPLRVAIFDDEDMVGLSSKGIMDFYRQCEALYERGDFTQVILVSNRADLTPSKDKGGKWHTILRSPRALVPGDAVVNSR